MAKARNLHYDLSLSLSFSVFEYLVLTTLFQSLSILQYLWCVNWDCLLSKCPRCPIQDATSTTYNAIEKRKGVFILYDVIVFTHYAEHRIIIILGLIKFYLFFCRRQ